MSVPCFDVVSDGGLFFTVEDVARCEAMGRDEHVPHPL